MTAQELWKCFSDKTGIDAPYEAWAFGDSPDKLADLVLRGIKTATSSAYPVYEAEGETLPKVGEYNVILDSCDRAVCITRTTNVYISPYQDISALHAMREGEGDRSLAYWRCVHESFFTQELSEIGMTFTQDMPVVCEDFELVYPPAASDN